MLENIIDWHLASLAPACITVGLQVCIAVLLMLAAIGVGLAGAAKLIAGTATAVVDGLLLALPPGAATTTVGVVEFNLSGSLLG